tara:strand:+ start:41557 stop:41664 length:108 start_codon:yes stop_codon:yes gene_type:complete
MALGSSFAGKDQFIEAKQKKAMGSFIMRAYFLSKD